MEAVKQGSASVGIKGKDCAVLVSLKRAPSELSAYQQKNFEIDEHVGISISGLTADARTLTRFMRTECMNHRYSFDGALPVSRLVTMVGNRLHRSVIGYGRRPFGVGILCIGHDARGPHLYQIEPSSNYFDCKAQAIGARSQSARTYLERHLDEFPGCEADALVQHALRALRDFLPAEVELSTRNVSISVVGGGQPLTAYENEAVARFLDAIDEGDEGDEGDEAVGAPAPMAE